MDSALHYIINDMAFFVAFTYSLFLKLLPLFSLLFSFFLEMGCTLKNGRSHRDWICRSNHDVLYMTTNSFKSFRTILNII